MRIAVSCIDKQAYIWILEMILATFGMLDINMTLRFLQLYMLKKDRKKTQLEKVRLMKVIELKLSQIELFRFSTLFVLLLMHANCFVWPT